MKLGVVNKSTILNRFVLHTLQRNITHLDIITRKTNINLGILKGDWKTATIFFAQQICCLPVVLNKTIFVLNLLIYT